MFRQGGAVNSGPTGILASSPSLIDAVAQDAMNVQGGPTVRMAEGGIVRRMANGGFIGPPQNPGALPAFLRPPPLRALPSPVTAAEATMKPRSERLSGEELLNLSLGARTILPPEIAEPIFESPASPVGPRRSSLPPSTIMREDLEGDADRMTMERLTTEYVQGDPDGVVREYLQSIAGTPAYGKIFSALQDAEMQMGQSGSQEIPTISDPTKFGDFERREVDTEMGTSDVIGPRVDDPTASDTVGEPGEKETAVTKTPATAPEADANIAAEIDALGEGQEEKIASNIESKGQSTAVTSGELDTPDNSFDLDKSIDEFVSKMPKPEGSAQTSGLKLLLLGASIFKGESPNAWKNVGDGLEKVLPSIIKDKEDEEKFLRNIRVAGAKYALTKRDKIEQEKRTAERARNSYFLDKEVVLRDDDGKVVKKFAAGWNRLNEKDFQQVKEITGANLVPESVLLAQAKTKAKLIEERIKAGATSNYQKTTNEYAVKFGDDFEDVKLRVRYSLTPGQKPVLLTPEKLVGAYESAVSRNGSLMTMANTASDLIDVVDEDVTGVDGILGKGQDLFRAYFDDPKSNPYFKTQEGTSVDPDTGVKLIAANRSEISDVNRYNTTLKFLAIQMAPILLGESGKTISDADRDRVAEALGLAKRGQDGAWTWVMDSSLSKGELQTRLGQVKTLLAKNREGIDRAYRATWREFGVSPVSIEESQEKARKTSKDALRLRQRKDKDGNIEFYFPELGEKS
tara:strand:- start:3975 stop:6200 length:2226 start_codon:yes stop_codon:yes gene_type:complete